MACIPRVGSILTPQSARWFPSRVHVYGMIAQCEGIVAIRAVAALLRCVVCVWCS